MMEIHKRYMQRCLELAGNGLGTTYPNPLVGSIVVHKDLIIGQGWHYRAGDPHAEVIAIGSVVNKQLLKNATLYVTLEPCNHYGKTPPCTALIIKSGIKNVVIGAVDSHEIVSGSGIKELKNAGITVITGILEKECRAINRRFLTFHEKKRPYVILKWAESADGFIAPEKRISAAPVYLSNELSRVLVHKWRTEEAAILVGTQTVLDDNPKLTARGWEGSQPIRLLIDRNKKVPSEYNILNEEATTLVFTLDKKNEHDVVLPFKNLPEEILQELYKRNIQSVIIEGGLQTLQSFIDAGLWDEARIFKCSNTLHHGVAAPRISGNLKGRQCLLQDELIYLES